MSLEKSLKLCILKLQRSKFLLELFNWSLVVSQLLVMITVIVLLGINIQGISPTALTSLQLLMTVARELFQLSKRIESRQAKIEVLENLLVAWNDLDSQAIELPEERNKLSVIIKQEILKVEGKVRQDEFERNRNAPRNKVQRDPLLEWQMTRPIRDEYELGTVV